MIGNGLKFKLINKETLEVTEEFTIWELTGWDDGSVYINGMIKLDKEIYDLILVEEFDIPF